MITAPGVNLKHPVSLALFPSKGAKFQKTGRENKNGWEANFLSAQTWIHLSLSTFFFLFLFVGFSL